MLGWSPAQVEAYRAAAPSYGFEGLFATLKDGQAGDRAWIYQSHTSPGIVGAVDFVTIASPRQKAIWVAWGHVHLFDQPRSRDSLVWGGAPWFRAPNGATRLTPKKAEALADLLPEVPWDSSPATTEASSSFGNDERRLWAPVDDVPAWRSARELATAVLGRPTSRAQLRLPESARVPRAGGRVLTVKKGETTAVFTLDADLDTLETLADLLDDDPDLPGHLVAGRSITKSVMSEARRVPGVAAWVCSRVGLAPRLERAIGSRRRLAPL